MGSSKDAKETKMVERKDCMELSDCAGQIFTQPFLLSDTAGLQPLSYEEKFKDSDIYKELYAVRNVKPAFHKYGLYGGMMYTGLFYVFGRYAHYRK